MFATVATLAVVTLVCAVPVEIMTDDVAVLLLEVEDELLDVLVLEVEIVDDIEIELLLDETLDVVT